MRFVTEPNSNIPCTYGSDIAHDQILPAFLKSCQWQVLSPLYRRSACELIGPWNEELECLEDWEYGCRAGAKGIHVCYCNETLAFVQEHNSERLSQKSLAKIATNLYKATWSIYRSLSDKTQTNLWQNILARHMLAASRAFMRTGNLEDGIVSLNDALKIAGNQRYKILLQLYVIISGSIGHQRFVSMSDQIIHHMIKK